MPQPVHYRAGTARLALTQPTACGVPGFSTTDTDTVTCPGCHRTGEYKLAALHHREVVEALAYPKEDHPCLNPPSSTSRRGT